MSDNTFELFDEFELQAIYNFLLSDILMDAPEHDRENIFTTFQYERKAWNTLTEYIKKQVNVIMKR